MSRQGLARHNARRDENERIIVQALEARGFHVDRISGAGIPDFVGHTDVSASTPAETPLFPSPPNGSPVASRKRKA